MTHYFHTQYVRIGSILPLFFLLLGTPVAQGASISLTDDTGRAITLPAPARKIIALYGGFNEILAAMGLENRLIARTNADTEPPSIRTLPAVGTHMRPNPELIAGLGPDCILQLGGRTQAMETGLALERLGLPVIFFQPSNFTELFDVIRRIGTITGEPDRADQLIATMRGRLQAVAQAVQAEKDHHIPSVFFEVRYPNLLGAGATSIVTDIIRHAGGNNVLQSDTKFVRLNEEELLRLNPEIYVVQRGPMNPESPLPAERPHFRTLRAVTDGNVLVVDEHIFSRPGPRATEAVEQLARFLHPQAFSPSPHTR